MIWDKRNPKGSVAGVAYQHESIIAYAKNLQSFAEKPFTKKKEHAAEMIKKVNSLIEKYGLVNNSVRNEYKEYLKTKKGDFSGGELAYSLIDDTGRIYRCVSMAAPDKPETRSHRPLMHPVTKKPCAVPQKGWRYIDKTMDDLLAEGKVEFGQDESTVPNQKYYLDENLEEAFSSMIYFGGTGSDDTVELSFDNPKPLYVMTKIVNSVCKKDSEDIILDFFSGSATTAHAVMQLNAEDSGKRKFIMVQLPEVTDEKSEAYKAGYKNICEIGKERIRRAGKKVREEAGLNGQNLDIGFRVLKCDSSNMEDVYYTPEHFDKNALFKSNVKADRSPEDLLFQVMLDLGIMLSSKIEAKKVDGKTVFYVEGNYLVACFDENVTEETITKIAKEKTYYFVIRDSSMADDSVATNFEQIFATYSPETIRKVL